MPSYEPPVVLPARDVIAVHAWLHAHKVGEYAKVEAAEVAKVAPLRVASMLEKNDAWAAAGSEDDRKYWERGRALAEVVLTIAGSFDERAAGMAFLSKQARVRCAEIVESYRCQLMRQSWEQVKTVLLSRDAGLPAELLAGITTECLRDELDFYFALRLNGEHYEFGSVVVLPPAVASMYLSTPRDVLATYDLKAQEVEFVDAMSEPGSILTVQGCPVARAPEDHGLRMFRKQWLLASESLGEMLRVDLKHFSEGGVYSTERCPPWVVAAWTAIRTAREGFFQMSTLFGSSPDKKGFTVALHAHSMRSNYIAQVMGHELPNKPFRGLPEGFVEALKAGPCRGDGSKPHPGTYLTPGRMHPQFALRGLCRSCRPFEDTWNVGPIPASALPSGPEDVFAVEVPCDEHEAAEYDVVIPGIKGKSPGCVALVPAHAHTAWRALVERADHLSGVRRATLWSFIDNLLQVTLYKFVDEQNTLDDIRLSLVGAAEANDKEVIESIGKLPAATAWTPPVT